MPSGARGTPADPESSRGAVLAIAGATLVAHLAVSWRHGFFRDELYFIDCGRHPAFGYVDQPPLIPLVAAATQLFGHSLVALRAVAGLAHAGTVVVCAALAGLVAGEVGLSGRSARRLAAMAVAVSPMFLGLTTTLNTTAFEPLMWTSLAYAVVRAIVRDEPRFLGIAGGIAGLAMEAKYAVPLFLVPLIAGVAVGPARRILATRQMLLGTALCVAIALPSAIWQLAHGLPFLELLRAASRGKNTVIPPLAFLSNQLQVMNPVLAPMWIGGVAWGLLGRGLARVRLLAIAFLAVLLATMLLHGKDYYAAPAYGVALALGAA
jgi:4-amino-4-deoxy-L-arabinose transferase-like glycosyltransferase